MPEIHKSNKTRQGVFISYARSDGKNFADDLRHRLIDEYHFQVWQDIVELEGGKDWWLQIEAAIKSVEFLVMVMTPGALASQTTRKEWRLARQEGVCVLPVMAEEIDFTTLPRWMRDTHFFDFKYSEQWDRFIRTLQSPCQAPRVPFMVEDKPDDFVERPEEFNQLLALLLDPKREEPIAITAALRGAGGYGKTTLTKALCHDEAIQNAFDDGILWVTLGENPGDLTGRVEDLIYTLSGERPGFSSVQAAAARLAELLAERDILLVIDDVWNSAHLTPFLQGGSRCSRLITTRNSDTLSAKAKGIDLDAMRPDEATSLLGFNLPKEESSGLQHLAQRLGEWPLLLKLVNATLRYRVHDLQQSFAAAIAYINAALDECGLITFDQDNATERHQAVAKTLEVSLQMLDEVGQQRYFELAIFPEDVNIPLATLEKLWSAAGYKPIHIEKLCEKLHKLSLLLYFDLNDRTIRLHDVMRQYLVHKIGADLLKLHAQFLDAYRPSSYAKWADLPPDETYLWRHLVYHLHQSGQVETLRGLLLDYDWLYRKLDSRDFNALIADYDFLPKDKEIKLVKNCLLLSTNQLTEDHNQLPAQLLGRLSGLNLPDIITLLTAATEKAEGPWFRPLGPSLTPPGGPLLRTLEEHLSKVSAVAISHDGQVAVSGSWDQTGIVWNLQTGEYVEFLEGHNSYINTVAITFNKQLVVSGSSDKTIKVWNLKTGNCFKTLEGHNDAVNDLVITLDDKFVVSASDDKTLKVWDLKTGNCLKTLEGHNKEVTAMAILSNGECVVSGSKDETIKIWSLQTGKCIRTLEVPGGEVTTLSVSPDGQFMVTAGFFMKPQIWSLQTGGCLRTLERGGHVFIKDVAITPDNNFIVIASADKTIEVWNLKTGKCFKTLEGHSGGVKAVEITSDGNFVVSASEDKTLKVWHLHSGEYFKTMEKHSDTVNAVAITPDGRHAVSGSSDGTLKVWELQNRKCINTLKGDVSSVDAVTITPNGQCIVSGSWRIWDNTLKVWDLRTGECLKTLKGHGELIGNIAIAPNGNPAVSACDNRIKVWDLKTSKCLRSMKGHDAGVSSVAITPDGQCVVSSSWDTTLKVWDLQTGKFLKLLDGHEDVVFAVAITPNGQRAVSGSGDGTLKVWDLQTGKNLRTIDYLISNLLSVAITPNGKIAVSGSNNNTLVAWNLQSGEKIAEFIGESSMICCAVAPDGCTIVAGDKSGRVHFLRLEGLEA